MTDENCRLISYLYTIPSWSPLEIAEELGLTFRQVCNFIDENCLRKMDIAVARAIPKATRAHSYQAEDWGYEVPDWRQWR